MNAIGLIKIELVDETDHELGEGEVFLETFVGDVEKGFVAGVLERIEILRKEGGDRAIDERGVVGDAIDGLALGDGFGELLLREVGIVELFVEGGAARAHGVVEFLAGVRQGGDDFQDLFAREFGLRQVGGIRRLIFDDGVNIVAAVLLLDLADAAPAAEGAERLFIKLFSEEVGRGRAHEKFGGLQFGDEGAGGLRGWHAAVKKERGGVRVQIEGGLGDVDGGVGIAEQARGEGLDVHARLRESEGQRKIIGGIGFLKIGVGDGVADNYEGIGRMVHLIKNLACIELEIVVGGFGGEHEFKARGTLGAGGLELLPEGVELFALGIDLGFIELGGMEAVDLGLRRAEGVAGGGFILGRGLRMGGAGESRRGEKN